MEQHNVYAEYPKTSQQNAATAFADPNCRACWPDYSKWRESGGRGAHLRVGLAEAPEEAAREPPGGRLPALHQRRQLVVVPHEAEAARQSQCAQHSGQRHLPGLVHHAHVKAAAHQQRMAHTQTRAAHLRAGIISMSPNVNHCRARVDIATLALTQATKLVGCLVGGHDMC